MLASGNIKVVKIPCLFLRSSLSLAYMIKVPIRAHYSEVFHIRNEGIGQVPVFIMASLLYWT